MFSEGDFRGVKFFAGGSDHPQLPCIHFLCVEPFGFDLERTNFLFDTIFGVFGDHHND